MKASLLTISLVAACTALSACDRGHVNAANGVIQTKYPGQVTAGGGTSGQVMARSAKPETNAVYAGGTPHIAGGAGGNTAGAALGGTVAETGQGPTRGVTPPTGAMQGGNIPPGDSGKMPAGAPAAGVNAPTPEASAVNRDPTPAAAPGTLTGNK